MSFGERLRLLLGLWFGLEAPVSRMAYATSGVGLMLAKYALDVAVVYHYADIVWTPVDYLTPLLSLHEEALGKDAAGLLAPMAAYTLPFLWIALSMTLRRALDAGASPWLTLAILVPGANYLVMFLLACLGSRQGVVPRW